MKAITHLLLLICSIAISFISFSGGGSSGVVPPPPGMPPCAVNPPPGESCATATPICNVHGFCGTTSASYTVDTWPQLGSTSGGGAFCGSIENNAFLSFTAESTTISFDAYVYNCPSSEGIQVFIFDAATCGSGPVTGLVCVNQMYAQNTPYDVTATGLTPGNQYYIMIDGYAGNVCDYTFVATEGVALPLSLSTGDEVTICMGESVTTTAIGGDGVYTWDPSPHLSAINGATVTVTPPPTVGTYTYTVHSSGGGVPGCPTTNDYTLTVHVEACCYVETEVASVNCNVGNGTYTANLEVNFSNPPTTGNLVITPCSGSTQTIPVSSLGSSPYVISLPGLSLNTPTCTIQTYFTGSNDCSHILNYNAPATTTPTFDPITICQGDQAPTLPSASLNGIPGTWSPATINNSSSGTYVFTPDPTYCSPVVNFNVTVNPSPDITVTSPVVLDCTNPSGIQLQSSSTTPGANFLWTDSGGGSGGIVAGGTTPAPTVNSIGNYIVTVTNPTTSCTSTATVVVNGNGSEPTVSIDPPGDLDCINSSETLQGNATNSSGNQNNLTYDWTTPDGSIVSGNSTTTPLIDGIGIYTFTVTDQSNGCITSVSVSVDGDLDGPVIDPITAPVISCNDSTVILSGNTSVANAVVSWSTADGNILGTQDQHSLVDLAGTYTFTATDPGNGCSSSVDVIVTGNTTLPTANAGPDLVICPNSTAYLQGQGSSNTGSSVTYSWDATDGNIYLSDFSNIPNPEVPTTATFILHVTDPSNNCTVSDTAIVVAHVPPVLFNDTTVCGTSFQVPQGSVSVQGTFTWSEENGNGSFNNNTVLNPLFTASSVIVNYSFILTDACTSDTVDVTIMPLPTISSPSDNCEAIKELVVNSYEGGVWSGTGVTFTPSPTVAGGIVTTNANANPGTYTVTFTYANNVSTSCFFQQDLTLVFPVNVTIFNDTAFCGTSFQVPAGSVTSTGSGHWEVLPAGSGTFSPSANTLHPTFTPNSGTITTDFTLIYVDVCDADSATVVIAPYPTVVQPPTHSCNDMSEILVTSSHTGGVWTVIDNPSTSWHEDTALVIVSGNPTSGGNIPSQTFVSSHPTAGTYTMSFTDNFCNMTQEVILNFLPYPWTNINDTTLCLGVQYPLSAWDGPDGQTYSWNTGATGQSITVNQPGLYIVTASNECYAYSDSATIHFEACDISAPNVISLSSQSGNNLWFVNSHGVADFHCIIVNRWGNLIYEYDGVNGHWDGRDMGGNIVSEGVYFYKIDATLEGGEKIDKHGFIQVVH
ncbi:hypothetical protein G5B10_11465 [Fluviicola sp. SGL-29]|nr:hypothetical protein [Fluviicola sp. SGL-29]